MNIAHMLVNAARRAPDLPAVTWDAEHRTYRELDARSAALAAAIRVGGARPGDCVGVYLNNRPEYLESMYAAFRGGFVLVPLNRRASHDEVRYQLHDCGARVLITDDIDAAHEMTAGDLQVVCVAEARDIPYGCVSYDDVVKAPREEFGFEPVDVDDEHPAWIFYTSGTTGRPKGATLSHRALTFVVVSWLADLTPMNDADRTLHACPLTHAAGFHAMAAVARGAHQLILPPGSFKPREVLALMRDQAITNTWMVPTQIVLLTEAVQDASRRGEAVSLPRLEYLVYGGAPIQPHDVEAAWEALGPVLVQLYAQGETPMTATVLTREDHERALRDEGSELLASVGYPRPGITLGIGDEDGNTMPPGTVGEVLVRGPAVMTSYWGRPDATADALDDGWLRTGDLGCIAEDGSLFLLGRSKDVIITGGSNVYPAEIERVLSPLAEVREVAVVGRVDRTWGETVVAFVVPEDPEQPHDEIVRRMDDVARSSLSDYKVPRHYEFISTLPRNSYGKVLKRDLKEVG